MQKINIESVVIVHGSKGSVATVHFSDPSKSFIISSDKDKIHMRVEKGIKRVLDE